MNTFYRAILSIPEIPESYEGWGFPLVLNRRKKGIFFRLMTQTTRLKKFQVIHVKEG